MEVSIDVLSVHYDAEIWGPIDPNSFNPSRFSSNIKRNPAAFLSFGIGPRSCIGMKFALIELKLALINLIQKYQILPGTDFPDELDFIEGKGFVYFIYLISKRMMKLKILFHESRNYSWTKISYSSCLQKKN